MSSFATHAHTDQGGSKPQGAGSAGGTHTTGIGSIVDGKYRIIAQIGAGGMSCVWLAQDERLHKLWAIKEIRPNELGVRGALMRQALIDEADFLKRLDHPAIPRVVDIIDTGRTTYVVMDYVEGRSLAQILDETRQPFLQEQVIAWGLQLCDVLSYLHSRSPQVIYRDLKPSNVMLREDGTVRLIDFGIAVEVGVAARGLGGRVGTPGYAAPEQLADGGLASHASPTMDMYALGATLYSLVSGHVPRRVEDEDGKVRTVFGMRPIREWNPRLSQGLERILLRATQPDPADRYPTIEEMRYDLEHHEWLTDAWREGQRHKVVVFRRWLVASLACALVGAACLASGLLLRQASYEELIRAAALASSNDATGRESPAETLYARAIDVGPGRVEPFARMVSLFEEDYRFSGEEERRMRALLAKRPPSQSDPHYAEFCYAMGVCYLSYYRIDRDGGSVGNAALQSAEFAQPWFARAIAVSDERGQGDALSPSDRQTAEAYERISGFYGRVTRSGIEGRPATEEYAALWNALCSSLRQEIELPEGERSVEGVRARLCQIAAEVLGSPSYLSGFARAGVREEQALELLALCQGCLGDLDGFLSAPEHAVVYGPMLRETDSCLEVAQKNIANVYHNPVARMDWGESEDD